MTTKPQSLLHPSMTPGVFEPADPAASPPAPPLPPPVHPRLARLAQLDQRPLAGLPRSLGPGGASALFARAVEKALVEEMAAQLRGGSAGIDSEIGQWAADIIQAFSEEGN